MGDFCMPSLGADMETGKLVEWLVAPGTRVKRGDIVALVETQKGLFEIEIFQEGFMGDPLVEAGRTVPVGTVLAVIHPEVVTGQIVKTDASLAAAVEPESPTLQVLPSDGAGVPTRPTNQGKRQAASPSARRLAAELGVDLTTVLGTGPHGVIQRIDIEQAARKPEVASGPLAASIGIEPVAPGGIQPGMRQAIAAAMSRSNREIPHYYLEIEIDMSRPLQWLETENLKRPIRERILPAVLLLKAVAKALCDVPELNGFWLDDRLQVKTEIHIGFAVSLRQGGLLSPALHDVDKLSLGELMRAVGDLIERTRAGRLRSSEMADATVSVTSLGDRGVKTVYGIIYPPQVALVAFGRIMERPWAEGGMVGARRCVTATLAADHRATDGHQGALFLEALNRYLQLPEGL
jgi:pyruvate dehydrogenase E2 component (dihydrolipoamide acetyltransferase)